MGNDEAASGGSSGICEVASNQETGRGASLVAQWLRILLPTSCLTAKLMAVRCSLATRHCAPRASCAT